jgi:hypothetical protein
MVHSYLQGSTMPTADFLRAAADVLKPVREEWLTSGTDPRTQNESAADAVRSTLLNPQLEVFLGGRNKFSASSKALFDDAWRALVAGYSDADAMPMPYANTIGVRLLEIVTMPFEQAGFRSQGDFLERELNTYYRAMLSALMLVIPDPGEGEEMSDRGVFSADGFEKRYSVSEEERKARIFEAIDVLRSGTERENQRAVDLRQELASSRMKIAVRRALEELHKRNPSATEAEIEAAANAACDVVAAEMAYEEESEPVSPKSPPARTTQKKATRRRSTK